MENSVPGLIRKDLLCIIWHRCHIFLLPEVLSTATHGSGVKNGNLSTAVRGLEIVIADGSIVNLSREKDGDNFDGAVVGLGALGIITKVTLDVLANLPMRQQVFVKLPIDRN